MNINKWRAVSAKLKQMGSVGVAFSGGVDSSVLLKLAVDILGENAAAVTFVSPLMPESELSEAKKFAKEIGARHYTIETNDLALEELRENSKERCYYCKKRRLEQAIKWADDNRILYIIEGSNADDKMDFRPGMRVLTELAPRVYSPFLEIGVTKKEIRQQAEKMGLPNWNKPSAACLASRIEYNTELSAARLKAIEKAEDYLRGMIKGYLRVRNNGMIARIEVAKEEMPILLEKSLEINHVLKDFGFWYVTLDLGGYRQGSQNDIFSKERFS